jgi:hypothetical protein
MTGPLYGFTIRITLGTGPETIRLHCEHCEHLLAETFNKPTLTELTSSAHSHRKVCP